MQTRRSAPCCLLEEQCATALVDSARYVCKVATVFTYALQKQCSLTCCTTALAKGCVRLHVSLQLPVASSILQGLKDTASSISKPKVAVSHPVQVSCASNRSAH